MINLKKEIISLSRQMGIDKIGFTSRECLMDAPPSGDLGYVLPSARSAISLAVALDKEAIRAYLSKRDQMAHVLDHKLSYKKLKEAELAIEAFLKEKGFETVALFPNLQYRRTGGFMAMEPLLSHRYVAVASGIGWIGWSGNLITPEYGAPVSLSTVVTSAELEPDPVVGGDFCNNCRLCVGTCPSHYIARKNEVRVAVAGSSCAYNKKASNFRCVVTCGGANGVSKPDAKWSTWSYQVLDLPGLGDEDKFLQKVREYAQDPNKRLLRALFILEERVNTWEDFSEFWDKVLLTCGNCMLVCWPKMEDRKENYRLLTKSGRAVRGKTGVEVVRS
jgi:epoxyqueuosine reductase